MHKMFNWTIQQRIRRTGGCLKHEVLMANKPDISKKPTDVEATANYYMWAQVKMTMESGLFRYGANQKRIRDVYNIAIAEMIRHRKQLNETEGHGE